MKPTTISNQIDNPKSKAVQKHSRLFYRWFFSYATILLIPIIICSYYYVHTWLLARSSAMQNQTLLLENTQSNIDERFHELDTITTNLQLMSEISSLSYAEKDSLNAIHYSYVLSLQNDFHMLQITNSISKNLGIYFPKSEYILTADTHLEIDLLPYMNNTYPSMSEFDALIQTFNEDTELYYILFHSEVTNQLYYVRKLVSNSQRETLSILFFTLDTATLQHNLKNHYLLQEQSEIGLLYNGTCLLSTNTELIEPLLLSEYSSDAKNNTVPLNNTVYIITLTDSTYPGIQLFSLTPKNIYLQQSNYLLVILVVTIVVCLSVGLITTLFYSRRQYRPIENILNHIIPSSPDKPQKGDEYEVILNHLIDSRNALAQQTETIHNEFLRRILAGEIQYQQINTYVKEKFSFSLPLTHSAVVIIHIEDYESFHNTVYQSEAIERPISLLHFIIQNVLQELLYENISQIYFCYLHSDIAVICNSDLQPESIQSVLSQALQKLLSFCQQHYQFYITAGISQITDDPNTLADAFTQAADALEKIHLFKGAKISCWQKEHHLSLSASSLLGSSETLVNVVFSGSSQSLEEYFSRLRKELDFSQFSIEEAKDMIYFFYHTSTQIKSQIYRQYGTEYITAIDNVNRGIFHSPLADSIEFIEHTWQEVCKELNSIHNTQQERFSDNICKYIDNNYNDINLNLNNIALHFKLSPAYLSRRFKQERDESVIDYLYYVRIKESLRLLSDNNMRVADIALLVGFQDSNAFIRIFKKEKGMTPGKYRETNFHMHSEELL